jgi:hypothetical protein
LEDTNDQILEGLIQILRDEHSHRVSLLSVMSAFRAGLDPETARRVDTNVKELTVRDGRLPVRDDVTARLDEALRQLRGQ